MKFLIVSGNLKNEGLCHLIEDSISQGAKAGGAETETVKTEGIERCKTCNGGWGICRTEHECQIKDGFGALQQKVKEADAICLISPVYWGEISESLKTFLDRLRRCEYGQNGSLSGKQILLVASPGGSGNGVLSCLEQMDRFCRHTGAVIFDYIGINRWNNDYKKTAAFHAAKAIASGRKNSDTIN